MTHGPETGTIDRLHFSGADFWYVYHANLRPDSSGTRFRRRLEHCSIPSQKVTWVWLKWRLVIAVKTVLQLFYAVLLFVNLAKIFRHIYLWCQKFSFQTHTERKIGTENRHQFPVPENGVDLWRRFMEHESWALVRPISSAVPGSPLCPNLPPLQ